MFRIVSTREFLCLCTRKKNYKHTYSRTVHIHASLPTLLAEPLVEQGTKVRSNTAQHFIKVCAKLVLAKHGHNIDNLTDDKVMF
jgi:hypothetical protein